MSNMRAVVTRPWFCAASTSCINVSNASVVDLPSMPPNWDVETRFLVHTKCAMRLAVIDSTVLPRVVISWMNWYTCGFE